MKVSIIGGGPAGLYSGILLKKLQPDAQITVFERNRLDDTFGFGVVFSDQTIENYRDADAFTSDEITKNFVHWDDIHTFYKGTLHQSTGHGFAGLARKTLLRIMAERCEELGVNLQFETEIRDFSVLDDADLCIAADGVNSQLRTHYQEAFNTQIDWRPNRFVWLGTTFQYDAFTFYFKENEHGLWRVHAYSYAPGQSTFIVECTDETLKRAGLENATEDQTIAYCSKLFSDELAGHPLLKNRSLWRRFPVVRNESWSHKNIVLLGDSAHTAHFSIGSGTKLAMEDAIALTEALRSEDSLSSALKNYEQTRRPPVESLQRAAQVSLEWFENTERYMDLEPAQFGFSLLTRSLRITHDNLRLRDKDLVTNSDEWFRKQVASRFSMDIRPDTPPMFTPFCLRELKLENRIVVSPMCQYSAKDGLIDDWHMVHLGSRAVGGAGLVMTEMTDVSKDARITPGCAGIYNEQHVEAWNRVTRFIHENSFSKVGLQLAHAGPKGSTKLLWEGMDVPLDDGNWPIVAASAIPYLPISQVPKSLDKDEMKHIISEFEQATRNADQAEFDLLELHMAHGYLLASFLSPLTNQRHDEFGGDIENRARFPLAVFDAMRRVWPEEKPMSVRISATDWYPGGISEEDVLALTQMLKEHGCDIIDVSAGQTVADQKPVYGRLFQTPFSELIRLHNDIPTMTVGNISSYSDVNSILLAGRADLCVLARAHLYDPYWTRHAAKAQNYDLRWPDQYSSLRRYKPRFE
ncbi:MAG: bifunctional salicylyl-CoA 5-hydroxylase/oxidoreductase [Myxococcota bacterium]|nr:bifunctional salicylyl-CoA 5-hydroxylase/oxidoreductase [Myxococcota bacterium]